MLQRFSTKASNKLKKSFAFAFNHLTHPSQGITKRITVIPGIYIGPEVTSNCRPNLDSVLKCFEACNVPVELDILENFSFDNEDHKKALLKNKYLLVGNLGVPGSKYIENTKVNKYLNLHFHCKTG